MLLDISHAQPHIAAVHRLARDSDELGELTSNATFPDERAARRFRSGEGFEDWGLLRRRRKTPWMPERRR
jgi:hypothetical protein